MEGVSDMSSGCRCGCEENNGTRDEDREDRRNRPLVVSGILAVVAEILSLIPGNGSHWLIPLLSLASIMICGIPVYKFGWKAILKRDLNINALMTIAVTGAALIGVWSEAAMVMFLFVLAERIEDWAADRARKSVEDLFSAVKELVSVKQGDGTLVRMDPVKVKVGNTVRVLPGERLSLDGRITRGSSTVNQAPITGESRPIEKTEGDSVFAGSINESGIFEYEVGALAGDSTLARITQSVREARANKAIAERLIDRFARFYTPVVIFFAGALASIPPLFFPELWRVWIYRALVVLLVACPCALVISTPLTIVSGLAAAAKRGILIKGGSYLENGHKLDLIAFDKTGTITRGKPEMTDYVPFGTQEPSCALRIAASLAACSNHPVSTALTRAAEKEGIRVADVEDPVSIAGMGTEGVIEGTRYYLGNGRFMEAVGIQQTMTNRLGNKGDASVFLFSSDEVLAQFVLADEIKESSRAAVQKLKDLGVGTLILSGDDDSIVESVARDVGVQDFKGNLLPGGKLEVLEELVKREKRVGMVGDGINDTPALAKANISFAMGLLGSEAALETADVAIMDDDLRKIPEFLLLSRATVRILSQNIALALGLKLIFLGLAVAGSATMWMAVIADVGVSLLVISNGLRLLGVSVPLNAS